MLYVYFGTNTTKVADQASRLVAALRAKQPNAQVFHIHVDEVPVAELDELIEARGLFVEKHVVVLKRPFVDSTSKDIVLERLERFAASPNIFILIEGALTATAKKQMKRHATLIEEHAVQVQKRQAANFALSDALAARDRKALWLAYMEEQQKGNDLSPVLGTLHWTVRSMLLASTTTSAEEAGMSPFPYRKAKHAAHNFTNTELRALSRSLIELYHDVRRGKHELATALELWVLTV